MDLVMLALRTVQEGFETDGSPLDWSKPASGCCSSPASKGGCCLPLGAKVVTNHLNQWLPGSLYLPMGTTWEVSSPPWLQGRCPQWEAAAPISQGWIVLNIPFSVNSKLDFQGTLSLIGCFYHSTLPPSLFGVLLHLSRTCLSQNMCSYPKMTKI